MLHPDLSVRNSVKSVVFLTDQQEPTLTSATRTEFPVVWPLGQEVSVVLMPRRPITRLSTGVQVAEAAHCTSGSDCIREAIFFEVSLEMK